MTAVVCGRRRRDPGFNFQTALHTCVLGSAHRMRGSPDFPVGFPGRARGLSCLPEGGGAPKRRRSHWGTFCEGTPPALAGQARLPALHRGVLLRRHRARLVGSDQGEPFPRVRPCCHDLSPDLCALPQGQPSHRRRTNDVAPGTRVRATPAGATPAPSAERLRKTPSESETN